MNTPEIQMIPIGELKPWPGNPRAHGEESVTAVIKSIKAFGFTNPVLAQRGTMRVLAGHGRLLAARQLGIENVPVIFLDFDERKSSAYTVADNRIAELSDWDLTKLKECMVEIDDGEFDVTVTGFEKSDLRRMFAGPSEEDENTDDEAPAKTVKCPKCGNKFTPRGK